MSRHHSIDPQTAKPRTAIDGPPLLPLPAVRTQAIATLCRRGGASDPRSRVVLVDSVVGLDEMLHGGLPITLLKLNASELASVTGTALFSLPHDPLQALETRALWLLDQHPQLLALAVTAGPEHAHLWRRVERSARRLHITYSIPRLPRVVNPIGAGDTCAAVTLAHLLASPPLPIEAAFAWGLLAATASCLREQTAEYDTQVVDTQLRPDLQLTGAWSGLDACISA